MLSKTHFDVICWNNNAHFRGFDSSAARLNKTFRSGIIRLGMEDADGRTDPHRSAPPSSPPTGLFPPEPVGGAPEVQTF